MKLLTAELREKLPKIYAQENTPKDERIVYAKFMFPAGNWTWFVLEGEEEKELNDWTFFGLVIGMEEEYGYFSLKELEGIDINGLKVERDLDFQSGKFKDVIAKFRQERN